MCCAHRTRTHAGRCRTASGTAQEKETHHVRVGLELGDALHELLGQRGRLAVRGARVAHDGRLHGRQLAARRGAREALEQRARGGVGAALVDDAGERRLLRAARLGGAGRHHHHLVPAEEAGDALEGVELAQLGAELLIGLGVCFIVGGGVLVWFGRDRRAGSTGRRGAGWSRSRRRPERGAPCARHVAASSPIQCLLPSKGLKV